MLTVRAMSGMSHPIPAHLVLMSRRQVLEEKDENFANVTGKDSTQLPRQPKPAPSSRVCCHQLTTELFNRRRVKAGKPKWPSLLLCPGCWWGWMQPSKMMHIIWSFLTDWLLRISSLDLTPMVSAVSFLSTNTCTLILALLSASKGKTKLSTRSMFL